MDQHGWSIYAQRHTQKRGAQEFQSDQILRSCFLKLLLRFFMLSWDSRIYKRKPLKPPMTTAQEQLFIRRPVSAAVTLLARAVWRVAA